MQKITAFMLAISDDACKLVIQYFALRVREFFLYHGWWQY